MGEQWEGWRSTVFIRLLFVYLRKRRQGQRTKSNDTMMISSSSVRFSGHRHEHDSHQLKNWTVGRLMMLPRRQEAGRGGEKHGRCSLINRTGCELRRISHARSNRIDRQTFKQFEQLTNFWINIARGKREWRQATNHCFAFINASFFFFAQF